MDCQDVRELIVLDLYGDAEPDGARRMRGHLEGCPACRLLAAEETRLRVILNRRPPAADPPTDLLDACRTSLSEALLDETPATAGSREPRPAAWSHRPGGRARFSPAFAFGLLAVGFACGWVAVLALSRLSDLPGVAATSGPPAGTPLALAANLSAVTPDAAGDRVRLSYETMQRTSLEGRIDDPDIRRLLIDTVEESPNAGLRLDALDLLGRHAAERPVREALLRALRRDHNTGARLKAMAALEAGAADDPAVREALLRALLEDDNAGVRVRAIDALVPTGDPQLVPAFERLARDDANAYVRMRAASFVALRRAPGDR